MANRIPADDDLALNCWARLTVIEQFSLAIIDRSFPQAADTRGTRRRRNALLATDVKSSLAGKATREGAPVSKVPVK